MGKKEIELEWEKLYFDQKYFSPLVEGIGGGMINFLEYSFVLFLAAVLGGLLVSWEFSKILSFIIWGSPFPIIMGILGGIYFYKETIKFWEDKRDFLAEYEKGREIREVKGWKQ